MVVQDDILYCMKTNKLKGDAAIAAVLHIHTGLPLVWSICVQTCESCKTDDSTSNSTPMHIGAYMTSQQLSVFRVVKGGDDVTLCHKRPK